MEFIPWRRVKNKVSKDEKWMFKDIPSQMGKVAIVTGANRGLGFEVAKALARKGARVIMACRSIEKAEAALKKIRDDFPDVQMDMIPLDLADLSSIRKFATKFKEKYDRLDILCNNAAAIWTPQAKTVDGFELQFGTNFLGHFALTGLLIDMLIKTGDSRVVSMSSWDHTNGKIHFDDLNLEKDYDKKKAYSQSKLAILLFAYELERKLRAAGTTVLSNASHPGWIKGSNLPKSEILLRLLNPILGGEPEQGALSMLYAATALEAEGGAYYGPGGMLGTKGYPAKVKSSEASHDVDVAKRLWDISEELTGIKYPI